MQILRKVIALSVIFVTVLSMSVVVAPQASAAATAGDLIKMNGLSSVYYLGGDGKRYVFPNESTYFSWYSDFSSVVTIPQAELESYPLGANVTVRPGTKLVKITTNPKVYAVEPGGNLVAIADEATAKTLFGDNWAKRIIDIPDAFFTNYKIASKVLSDGIYPTGSLIKTAASPDIYYINANGTASKIASESAFTANRFRFSDVVIAATMPTIGAEITSGVSTITDTSSGAGGTVYTGGSGLTVSLSGVTTQSSTVVIGQALADIASFNMSAANDGAVKLTSIKLKRLGISGDAALSNIYLYDGATRLTDAGSLSSGVVTFSDGAGIMTLAAGQTKTLSVKSDIAGASGNTVGLGIAAATDVVAGGATISGSFPANGNLMSVAQPDASTIGSSTLGVATNVGAAINAGTNQVVIWSDTLNIITKAAKFKYIALKQIGTAPYDAFQNYKLFIDGVQAGSALAMATTDGTVALDVTSNPVDLQVGSHTVEVRADAVKGSSRNFQFSLQTSADIVVMETGYGVNITPGGTFPFTPVAQNINNGSLSVSTDSTLSNTQVVKGSTNVALGRYSIKAYGEDTKIKTLNVVTTLTGTSTATQGLSNVTLFVNGSAVGSSKNALGTALSQTLTYGTTNLFTVKANETVTLEIRGDLTQDAVSQILTVDANLQIATSSATGQSSQQSYPASLTTYGGQAALSVVTGSLSAAKDASFQNQNVLANTQKVKIASFKLQAGSAEDVNVTSMSVALGGGVSTNDMSNLYVSYDSVNTDPVQPQATNNFSSSFTIPANGYKTISVYVDLGSNATTTASTTLVVNYRGSKTNTSATASVAGQVITVAAGSLAAPTLVSTDPSTALVAGGTQVKAATYKFVATNGTAIVSEATFNVTTSDAATSSDAISGIIIDGKTFYAVNGVISATGLSITVPAGTQGLNVPVTGIYSTVTSANQGGISTRSDVKLVLTYYKYAIANTVTTNTVTVASNVMIVVASVPSVASAAAQTPGVSTGYVGGPNKEVLRFTVTAPVGQPINLRNIGFTPTYVGATNTQLVKIYDSADLNTALNAAGTALGNSGVQGTVAFDADFPIAGGETKTFIVKVDTSGVNGTGESFQLSLTTADATIAANADWKWNDTTVSGTYGGGYKLKNLPVDGNVFNN